MAGSKCAYYRNKTLDNALGSPGTAYTPPGTVYLALSTAAFTAAATGSAMNEVTGSGYTRLGITNNSANWPNASSGVKANGAVFTFPTATASWGTVASFYIVDASSGGNCLYGADLGTARSLNSGDTASFAIGAISLSEN